MRIQDYKNGRRKKKWNQKKSKTRLDKEWLIVVAPVYFTLRTFLLLWINYGTHTAQEQLRSLTDWGEVTSSPMLKQHYYDYYVVETMQENGHWFIIPWKEYHDRIVSSVRRIWIQSLIFKPWPVYFPVTLLSCMHKFQLIPDPYFQTHIVAQHIVELGLLRLQILAPVPHIRVQCNQVGWTNSFSLILISFHARKWGIIKSPPLSTVLTSGYPCLTRNYGINPSTLGEQLDCFTHGLISSRVESHTIFLLNHWFLNAVKEWKQ